MIVNFKKISFITIFGLVCHENFTHVRCISNLFKIVYRQLSWHCPCIQRFYHNLPCIYISFCILMNSMIYPTLISFIRSSFTFSRMLVIPILLPKENEQNQVQFYEDTFFESCSIHQLEIIYRFECTNQDIQSKPLFENLYKLLLHAHNLH